MSTTVAALVDGLPGARLAGPLEASAGLPTAVVDATHDSRAAGPGWLFCAMVGEVTDGHLHADAAVAAGAAALLVERELELPVAQVQVADTRRAAGPAASIVHGHPSRQLAVVGVTGTNGKTTTTYLLESAFAAAGLGTGVIGTIACRIDGESLAGVRTTPEGTDLQRLLRTMVDRGVGAVAMEASSHGLALHRVDGIDFDVAVHLNLTQDHLDFHRDMEDYRQAKARLFTLALRGVVCVEDDAGRQLATQAPIEVVTFGRPDRCAGTMPDWSLVDLEVHRSGTRFVLVGEGRRVELSTRLVGDVNALNAAAAWLAARAAGLDEQAVADGIAACPGVPGRLEPVPGGGRVTVLVDYAHTPDAVDGVVHTARVLADGGRVLVVLGCGGDRDRAKRGPMGAAAAGADVAVLTSDNPRSEDPEDILDAMEAGARAAGGPADLRREADREAAIALALDLAAPGDVVVIAGKGHETGQVFADRTVAFDDREVAARLLAERHPA